MAVCKERKLPTTKQFPPVCLLTLVRIAARLVDVTVNLVTLHRQSMADPSEMTLDKDETLKTTVLDLLQKGDSRKRSLPKHLRCTKILIDLFPKPYKLKIA